ncbi:MAG: Pyruvate kinase [Planctomycetes bacterium ADurb.Bin126]|nr:MAG: Pyruvate kinase [Planctomycetes bacterium ADurb.Bin126]HOD80035.1 pyruvate kinase [Phycisphaerae bacterium]HQL73124.1 pyruvate kinase [Phycisphaerae bacterium]
MLIRTKIVATLGPASSSLDMLRRLVRAGCDVFRVNFSHGTHEQHAESLRLVRQIEDETGSPLAVLADLCGPKIRVSPIGGGSVLLAEGQTLAIQREPIIGQADRISTTLAELVDEVQVGESVLLDDGRIRLEVVEVRPGREVVCRVVAGGILSSGKGVNLPGTKLTLSALTEKDHRDLAWLVQRDFDYVALSFVRRPEDIQALRDRLGELKADLHIVAKIEKPQALHNLEPIVEASDAVMVARGDLGVEMSLPAVPVAQKMITALCHRLGKPCIVATQMLESMIQSPTPTRAEVSDVANAVMDAADAVMLSGETAVGKFPAESVAMMNRVVEDIQAYHDLHCPPQDVAFAPARTAAALAGAVREIIRIEDIKAVAAFSMSGLTARMFAKHRLRCPILGISPDRRTLRRMGLYYGVIPVQASRMQYTQELLDLAQQVVLDREIAAAGEKIVVVCGRPLGSSGKTNTLIVHTIA